MKPVEQAYANGWTDLVPEAPGKKYPTFKDWQKFQMTEEKLKTCIDNDCESSP